MMDSKTSLEVTRSFYAQMCQFREETEKQHLDTERSSKKTSILVQGIGTLLLVFVIVIGVYMTQLTNQFIHIVESIEKMNSRAVTISELMSHMTEDVTQMNQDVSHMHAVLKNMKQINSHISIMEQEVNGITTSISHLDKLGEKGMKADSGMNQKMSEINRTTSQMELRMYQISKPMKAMPSH